MTRQFSKLNHQDKTHKKIYVKSGILLLLVLSLSLNVYYIFFKGNEKQAVEMAEAPPVQPLEQAEETLPEPPVEPEADPAQTIPAKSEDISQSLKVQHVKFSSPENFKGRTIHSLDFKIKNSLNYSVCKVIPEDNGCEILSAHMGRLLVWFFEIKKNMWRGDRVKVIYEETNDQERFNILKFSYYSHSFDKTFEANYFKDPNKKYGAYYDPEGREISKRLTEEGAPIRDYKEITSLPGDYRKGYGGHSGTDFKADVGTPVYASFDGKVLRKNWNVRKNGYCLELDHPTEGIKTLYLHLSETLVKPGAFVKKGQHIAFSGNTGRSFAPHLHYEIQKRTNKRAIYNPFEFDHHKSYYSEIPKSMKKKYRETVSRYEQFLKKA